MDFLLDFLTRTKQTSYMFPTENKLLYPVSILMLDKRGKKDEKEIESIERVKLKSLTCVFVYLILFN